MIAFSLLPKSLFITTCGCRLPCSFVLQFEWRFKSVPWRCLHCQYQRDEDKYKLINRNQQSIVKMNKVDRFLAEIRGSSLCVVGDNSLLYNIQCITLPHGKLGFGLWVDGDTCIIVYRVRRAVL